MNLILILFFVGHTDLKHLTCPVKQSESNTPDIRQARVKRCGKSAPSKYGGFCLMIAAVRQRGPVFQTY